MKQTREQLLQAYAALPEPYQPAWGLDETATQARRGSADRFAVLLQHIAALPGDEPLRVLDIGCAQGYFGLGLIAELRKQKRSVEVIGVDSLADNVRFCEQLADHHGLQARFIHDRFDAGFFERHSLDRFDAVLALNVLHHIRGLQGAQAAETALAAIRTHSRVLLCELAQPEEALDWVDDWHDSDHALLHGYAFRRRLGEFETHLTQVRRPLYVCSNELACVDGRWFAFDHVQDRAHPGVPDRFAGQRRFFLGKDTIVKAYRGAGDFGAFNRAELKAEAEVLQALSGEPRRYPPLLSQADDGDTLWLARGILPGRLLSEAVDAGEDLDAIALAGTLLDELAHLEQRGFHHADIRIWNILQHRRDLRLIDFGSMTPHASPLHRVALAAVLRELAQHRLSHQQSFYSTMHSVDDVPASLRPLLRYLYGCAQADFGYARARRLLGASDGDAHAPLMVHADILAACAQEQCEAFVRQAQHAADAEQRAGHAEAHARDLERTLKRQTADSETERKAARKGLKEATLHADSLKADLAESRQFVESLRTELAKVTKDAAAERAAAQTALSEAALHADSLKSDLAASRRYVESLQMELAKITQDGAAERAAAQSSMMEAARYAESLNAALGESRRYVESLERELADVRRTSAEHENALARALARLGTAERDLQRMRARFRVLKVFWPREPRGDGNGRS